MSTFIGIIDEIPGITIDRFNSSKTTVNFLSHCHTDHMVGLNEVQDVYASPISATILRQLYPRIMIQELEIGVATRINLKNDTTITVTALPAGHCPGSVMFLFETNQYKVLYTGDFRILSKDIKCYQKLNYLVENGIHLNTIYIDSTFMNKNYTDFPSQQKTSEIVCQITKNWLNKSPDHKVYLHVPALYGSEYIFQKLSKHFGLKVHVDEDLFSVYKHWKCMDNCVGSDRRNSRIFASFQRNAELNERVCYIRVSAMCWMRWKPTDTAFKNNSVNSVNVCYSNHASYNEIRDFVNYLQPMRLRLNVLPDDQCERETMLALSNELTNKYKNEFKKIAPINSNEPMFLSSALNIEFRQTKRVNESSCDYASASVTDDAIADYEELDDLSLVVIPKRRKRDDSIDEQF